MKKAGLLHRGICLLLCLVMLLSMTGCGEIYVGALDSAAAASGSAQNALRTAVAEAPEESVKPEESAGQAEAAAAAAPAETQADTPADKAAAENEPAETEPAKTEPEDLRSALQRAIEDESGAYVQLTAGAAYGDEYLSAQLGSLGSGIAFAVSYAAHAGGTDAVRIAFRTADSELLTAYIPAYFAAVLDRQQTLAALSGFAGYEVMPGVTLPMSAVDYFPLTAAAEPVAVAEPSAEEVQLTLMGEGMLAANGSGNGGEVVDQALVAQISHISNYYTGSVGQAILYSSFSTTDQDESATVIIPLTYADPNVSYPQFTDDGTGRLTYNVAGYNGEDNKDFVLTLADDGNGPYITYTLNPGDTLYTLLKATVPNGYSENPTTVVFETPIYRSTFTGNAEVKGDSLNFVARFGW